MTTCRSNIFPPAPGRLFVDQRLILVRGRGNMGWRVDRAPGRLNGLEIIMDNEDTVIPRRAMLDDNDIEDAILIDKQIQATAAQRRFNERARRGIVEYEPEDLL